MVAGYFEILVALFKSIVLQTHGTKTKAIVCTLVFLCVNQEEVIYHHRMIRYIPLNWYKKLGLYIV